MTTIQTHEVIDWLGPEGDRVSPEQVEEIRAGWQRYADSVADREGEPGDHAKFDQEVGAAIAMVVLGDDLELEALGRQWRADRQALYARTVGAVHAGMSEVQASRVAGIDRMTLRRLLGKL